MENSRTDGAMVIAAQGFKDNAHLPRGFDWRAFDAYLFDIDGTLLNSRDAVHYESYLNAMQAMYGRRIGLEGLTLHGSTDPLILMAALEREGISREEGRTAMKEASERMCCEVERRVAEMRPELCVSVGKLLDELKDAGKVLAVASGNVERIGLAKLRAAGIDSYFSFGSFSDRNESRCEIFRWGAEEARRRLGDGVKLCFVGDTPADVQAAKACGVPVIAVATGIFSLLDLAREEPDMCIPTCETLWSYAQR
jgi:phosphoglycolate phosphatase-like HAD superfamily hydrolase